jgi:hypothetical protein
MVWRAPAALQFRNPLLSVDGTIIELCATIYDWAKYQRAKGAAKLHWCWIDSYLPRLRYEARPEVKVARGFILAGDDRGV